MISIREQIGADVLDVLGRAQRASGYSNDLNPQAVQELPAVPSDSLCVLFEGEPAPEDEPSLGHAGWNQPYTVRAWGIESENGGLAPNARLASLAADIIKVIMIDPHRSRLAHNTYIRNIRTYPQNVPPAVDVEIEVFFRTLLHDPYTQ